MTIGWTNPASHGQRLFGVPVIKITSESRHREEYDPDKMHPEFVFTAELSSLHLESNRQEIVKTQDSLIPQRPNTEKLCHQP